MSCARLRTNIAPLFHKLIFFGFILGLPLFLLIVGGLAYLANFIRVKPEYMRSLNHPLLMSPLLLSLLFLLIHTEQKMALGKFLFTQDARGMTTCKGYVVEYACLKDSEDLLGL